MLACNAHLLKEASATQMNSALWRLISRGAKGVWNRLGTSGAMFQRMGHVAGKAAVGIGNTVQSAGDWIMNNKAKAFGLGAAGLYGAYKLPRAIERGWNNVSPYHNYQD